MTHTPGPWHIGRSVYDINDSQGRLIATFFRPGWWYPENEDEGISNRALGLAAPDMLAALKLALKQIKDTQDALTGQGLQIAGWHLNGDLEPVDGFFSDSDCGAVEAVEAAITKAEGRSK